MKAIATETRPQVIMTRPIQKRAPTLCRMMVEGTSKSEVAKEEDAGAEAEHLRRQANISVHGQGGKAYVDAVEKGYEVKQHQERNEPPGDLANRTLFEEAGKQALRCRSYSSFACKLTLLELILLIVSVGRDGMNKLNALWGIRTRTKH